MAYDQKCMYNSNFPSQRVCSCIRGASTQVVKQLSAALRLKASITRVFEDERFRNEDDLRSK